MAYTLRDGTPVTAKIVEVSFSGLSLTKGNLTIPVPAAGATTKAAYVLVGNHLCIAKGERQADGLGIVVSRRTAVKQ